MFGSGLPVCALAYNCISELVLDQETGLLFSTPEQLAEQLQQLLAGFPSKPSSLLTQLQQGVAAKEQRLRWADNWQAVAWPVICGDNATA
jgi:beta-1,4-mannosyltransferase